MIGNFPEANLSMLERHLCLPTISTPFTIAQSQLCGLLSYEGTVFCTKSTYLNVTLLYTVTIFLNFSNELNKGKSSKNHSRYFAI